VKNKHQRSAKEIEKFLPSGVDCIWGQKFLLQLKKSDFSRVVEIANKFNISIPIAQVLYNRGFTQEEQIRSFLFSSFEKDTHSPLLLKSADVAVERILQAITNQEKILVFGDYDVDGITATALFMSSLLPLGAKINFHLPNRAIDGYGLSKKVVKNAAAAGFKLIITVDNGITAFDAAKEAAKQKIDLIITDHHLPHEILPKALAIVDPNQSDCLYPYKKLSGAGVVFKLLSLIYERRSLQLPPKAYELLMLSTVADVMPLTGENRFWVQFGLAKINQKRSYAINVLALNSKLEKSRFNSLDIGFKIAPQLNALGRLSDPRDAVKFLISSDKDEVDQIGKTLFEMNEARKKIEREIYEEIVCAINQKKIDLQKENVIIASAMSWPAGVIGLVAGRLMHSFGRPAFLFHMVENGILKGSCRSIPAFNVFECLKENEDLLLTFGGHSCAAGLSLKHENLPKLKERLEEKITKELTPYDLMQKVEVDAELSLSDVNSKLVEDLVMLEPFGNQNVQPVFFIKNVTLLKAPQLLKDKHVKISVFSDGVIKPVIFFDRQDLYQTLSEIGEKSFSFVGSVSVNEWQGRSSIELEGLDVIVNK